MYYFAIRRIMSGHVSVLHVDDEPDVLDLSKQLFDRTDSSLSMVTAGSGPDGLEALQTHDVDCIVSDSVRMPDGQSFIEAASRETDAPIVLFTAKEWRDVADDALAADVSEYVRKADPSDYRSVLRHVLRLAADDARTSDENRHLIGRHDFSSHAELGVSIVEAVERFVDTDATELDPLYDAVDADALERLLAPSARSRTTEDVEVHFSYADLDLTVTASGSITVSAVPS